MNIVKSFHSSFIHQCFNYQEKHYFSASVIWGFRLTDGEPVLEQELWQTVGEALDKNGILDTGMPKAKAEVLVTGHCYSGGDAIEASTVSLSLGNINKKLAVFGDRHWIKTLGTGVGVSQPVPFKKMAIDYSNAFGGKDFVKNPVGRGIELEEVDGEEVQILPNVEYPDQIIGSPKDRPAAAGFSRVDQMCEQRMKRAGTYDQKYIETRMPGFPDDLNLEYFNDAAEDQWFDVSLDGSETFEIKNMNAEHKVINGRLPPIKGRCFVDHEVNGEIVFKEIDLKLDTVHFFPGEDVGILIHRGMVEVNEDDACDIKKVIISHEKLGDEERESSHYQQQLDWRTDTKISYRYLLDTTPLIPVGYKCGIQLLIDSGEELGGEMQQNLETFAEQKKAESEKQASEALQTEMGASSDGASEKIAVDIAKQKESSAVLSEEEIELKKNIEKALPKKPDGSGELDISKMDLDAFEDVEKSLNKIKEKQEGAEEKRLHDELAEAKASGNLALATQLEKIIADMNKPPVLPRVDKEAIKKQLDDMDSSLTAELHKMKASGVSDEALIEKSEKARAENNKQVTDNLGQMVDGYRLSAHCLEKAVSPHDGQEKEIAEELIQSKGNSAATAEGDYAYVDLTGQDLSGVDLSGAYLEYADLTDVDFTGANLSKAILSHANLTNTNFSDANLNQANLGACNIDKAKFNNARVDEIILTKSKIEGAVFTGCDFSERMDLFQDVTLASVAFTDCDLQKGNFIDIDLSGCSFVSCNLEGANFINPAIEGADFEGSNLSGVNFISAKAARSNFKRATMKNVRFINGAELEYADFSYADVSESNLRDCDLKHASFNESILNKTDFGGSELQSSQFVKSVAKMAQFNKSNLEHALLDHIDLMEGSMHKAKISSASFFKANLYGVNFLGCTVGDTNFNGADMTQTVFKDWRP